MQMSGAKMPPNCTKLALDMRDGLELDFVLAGLCHDVFLLGGVGGAVMVAAQMINNSVGRSLGSS
jgi:hypothetical protein